MIVGRACAFGRNHGRAQRIFRRALHGKRRAFVRLLDALENQAADALRRLARRLAGEGKAAVSVVLLKAPAKLEAARRNFAKAAPLPGNNFEYFMKSFPLAIGIQIVALFALRSYRGVWRHFGLMDAVVLAKGVLTRQANSNRIYVTAIDSLTPDCSR